MKKILLFAVVLVCQFVSAQITLEHQYPQNLVNRIKLEQSGEKYHVLENTTGRLLLYNADHTLWKTVDLMIPNLNEFSYISVAHVSEQLFNDNAAVEVAYSFNVSDESGSYRKSQIISESGVVLQSFLYADGIFISELPNLQTKIFVYGSNGSVSIYDPNLLLQHTFEMIVGRSVLENSGEKYFMFDKSNENLKLFNSDYTLWKTVSLPKPAGSAYSTIHFISETAINADAQLEIGYDCFTGSNAESRIVNENGDVLLSQNNIGLLSISKIDGLPTKLIASGVLYTENYPQVTNVYSLPSLTLEHHYDEWLNRIKLEIAGEKYYSVVAVNNAAKIYNADHTLWKTISSGFEEGRTATFITHISQTIINDDDAVVVAIASELTGVLEPYPQTRLVDENGVLLSTMESVSGLYLSSIDGLVNKFIANGVMVGGQIFGQVYAVDVLNTKAFDRNAWTIYPNPASDIVNFKNIRSNVAEARLFNMLGSLVYAETGIVEGFSVDNFPAGTYLLKLKTADGSTASRKIIVKR